jgi:hypothetical protein
MFMVEHPLILFHCFHNCTLANEVVIFFRVDNTPPIAEESCSLWQLELAFPFPFPFPFHVIALARSRSMGPDTSSLVLGSLDETHGEDESLSDFALHLGWCFTASHHWKRLNSEPPSPCHCWLRFTHKRILIIDLVEK